MIAADIAVDAGQAVIAAIQDEGGCGLFVETDLTSDESVSAAARAAAAHFGNVHILFNCAGGSLPDDGPVTEVEPEVWERTMNLDVRGTMLACRHVIPLLIAAGGGSVVNMSSGSALRGSNSAHVYTAAKGAIVSLTRTLAGTYARYRVRANAICAGRVNTERVRTTYGLPGRPGSAHDPMRVDEQVLTYPFWLGEPEDIANIALFLAGEESRMITGASIPADGGRSAY